MSYSLSQLDAIGDVDPVAEADVYLAYGRDLQAEEILKEAMRSNPERLAIRTKLLEVYAKRRDTKGFEQLANQLYALSHGEGEDWEKAQELGRGIDPENQLYQPGGRPADVPAGAAAGVAEPLGASTMPQSVLPSSAPRTEQPPVPPTPQTSSDIDLDLDISAPMPLATEPSEFQSASAPLHEQPSSLGFDLNPPAPAAAPAGPRSRPGELDLSGISLDLDAPSAAAPASAAASELPAFELPAAAGGLDDGQGDPLARKIELAEEFRQIGDLEGARDLLQEVIAKADGALKQKAQNMFDSLG
jgi:pilus assembly protein FimV